MMLWWIVPLMIVGLASVVAFGVTPADPFSFYIGWAGVSLFGAGAFGFGWWARGKSGRNSELAPGVHDHG